MKKYITLILSALLIVAMSLSLYACNKDKNKDVIDFTVDDDSDIVIEYSSAVNESVVATLNAFSSDDKDISPETAAEIEQALKDGKVPEDKAIEVLTIIKDNKELLSAFIDDADTLTEQQLNTIITLYNELVNKIGTDSVGKITYSLLTSTLNSRVEKIQDEITLKEDELDHAQSDYDEYALMSHDDPEFDQNVLNAKLAALGNAKRQLAKAKNNLNAYKGYYDAVIDVGRDNFIILGRAVVLATNTLTSGVLNGGNIASINTAFGGANKEEIVEANKLIGQAVDSLPFDKETYGKLIDLVFVSGLDPLGGFVVDVDITFDEYVALRRPDFVILNDAEYALLTGYEKDKYDHEYDRINDSYVSDVKLAKTYAAFKADFRDFAKETIMPFITLYKAYCNNITVDYLTNKDKFGMDDDSNNYNDKYRYNANEIALYSRMLSSLSSEEISALETQISGVLSRIDGANSGSDSSIDIDAIKAKAASIAAFDLQSPLNDSQKAEIDAFYKLVDGYLNKLAVE